MSSCGECTRTVAPNSQELGRQGARAARLVLVLADRSASEGAESTGLQGPRHAHGSTGARAA